MGTENKIRAWGYYLKRCEELSLAVDLYDFEHEVDGSLSYAEMISLLEEDYFGRLKQSPENCENKQLKKDMEKQEGRQEQYERELQTMRNNADSPLISLFNKPRIIGVVADINTGKSMLLYHLIAELKKEREFKLFIYGFRCKVEDSTEIHSVEELEQISNSVIVLDEFFSLFDLDNRKYKSDIENSLRLINHKNNILIIAGVGENFKKFISNKLDAVIFKNITITDLINGSRVKNIITNYKGLEAGSSVIALELNEAIIFDGKHYRKINCPYYEQFDSKRKNCVIFCAKNVPLKV